MRLNRRRRRKRQTSQFTYSAWDGTQAGFDMNADDVFGAMTDELLEHGDINSALSRMLRDGFTTPDGDRMQGLREIMEQLRERRQESLERHNLDGVYGDIAEELREVVEQERQALDTMSEQAAAFAEGGDDADQRSAELAQQTAAERQLQLDMLSPDLAGMVKDLQNYEFTSDEAQQRFEELLDKLREQLMQQFVDQATGAVEGMSPEDMARMKDMMAALNEMLEQRQNGQEPDFEKFMEEFGDFFPENPQTLDELLEAMAQRMAAMQQMLNSMTPEQRAQMQQLSDQLLEDMDLRWQMEQLGQNLQQMFPQMGWDQGRDFEGQDPLNMGSAMDLLQEMGDLDQLENLLQGARNPGALAEVDIDRARDLLGDDAANSLQQLSDLAKMLEDAGYVNFEDGKFDLTARAIRRLGQNALSDLFSKLKSDALGRHNMEKMGVGHERAYDTKPYEFGDPFNLHIEKTVRNAVQRSGGGTPVRLTPEDFEVERTEKSVRSSTVLMLDLSMSMPMRGNFLPAKKVAMALHSLIQSQYPRDFLGIVTFAALAHEIKPEHLPQVSWDYDYGTNMQHGFQLARRMLSRQTGTKQIIMITDGEPTAHLSRHGAPIFNYPPTRETVDLTLAEVARCTRDDIVINTFMLDATHYLQYFIEQITKMNGGRAFYTTNENIGDYVLVDFVEHKRKLIHGR
ncbi:MAG: hypothetical protein HKN26_02300 [Acidimicrobiales bacterium]|nr:hypothetical protein [Acidimicrobiales bacterium]